MLAGPDILFGYHEPRQRLGAADEGSWAAMNRDRSRLLERIVAVSTLLVFACAGSPQLDAHLAISPDRSAFADSAPRFTSCESCPEKTRALPGGRTLAVSVAAEALYSIRARDTEELIIFEERSPFVRGTLTFTVIAVPTDDWLDRTKSIRNSYPYDTVAWLDSGQLVAVGPNINARQQGSFGIAAFFCRSDATKFAERFSGDARHVTQSDSEYEALVAQMNSNIQESLAEVRRDPKSAEEFLQGMSPKMRGYMLTGEIQAFPVEPSIYYGTDYKPMDCD